MQKFLKKIVKYFGYLVALLLLKFIRIFGLEVRFCKLLYQRIGHFCGDFILYEANQRVGKHKKHLLFLYNGCPANAQWEKVFKRNALVMPKFVTRIVDFERLAKKQSQLFLPTHFNNSTRDVTGVVHKVPKKSWLLKCEEIEVEKLLGNRGWRGEPIITIHIRDSGYLSNNELHQTAKKSNWSYHSYRDSNIDSYSETVSNLIKLGYFICRIGKNTNKRLPITNKNYIDCWHDDLRLDLVDIWLCLNSKMVVSTASGIDSLAAYSGIPVCFVNAMPLKEAWTFSKCLWVPKNCYWKKSGRSLTFHEMIIHSYFRTEDYQAAGIILEDLTSDEITDGVMETLQRLDGTWQVSEDELAIKRKIEKILMSNPNFDKEYGFFHPQFSFGMNWIRSKGPGFLE